MAKKKFYVDLDLQGNKILNGGFEVVTSLPATNNFVGRQVTYQGRSYIWDGSSWKNDSDYLEIGGRNLLANTQNMIGTPYRTDDKYLGFNISRCTKIVNEFVDLYSQYTINIVSELEYIVSFYAKGSVNSGISCYFYSPNTTTSSENSQGVKTNIIDGYSHLQITTEWQKYWVKWKQSETTSTKIVLIGRNASMPDGSILEICGIKLEKGNIPTDWTPAPEDKANEIQTINFDTNNVEPTQTGTVAKTSTWLWQYLTQSVNYTWLKLKTWVGGLFSAGSATTNNNYLPKIDDVNKKLVKSNIYDDGTNVGIGTTNPQSPLSIKSASDAEALQIIGRFDNYSNIVFANADLTPNFLIESGTNNFKLFSYNTGFYNPRLAVQLGGNVGIGTSAPNEKLDVNGNVKANGYKVGEGTDTKLLTDGGGTKLITDFATSTHNHTSIVGYANGIQGGNASDLNAIWLSTGINNGVYAYRFSSDALNIPPGVVDDANWVMNIFSHGTEGIGAYGHQLAGNDSGDIYFRRVLNGGFGEWKKLWNSSNFDPVTKADLNHNHNTTYLGISAQASDSAKLGNQLPSYYEPAFNKNTAFNKTFGTGTSDVARGDHVHNYTTSTDVSNLINTAIASVYKPKGNIANKAALLALTNVKQGDVYNAQASFTLNGQNIKIGDNIVCLANATTSAEANWDNLGGNIDFAAALSQALVGFSATSGNINSSNTILEAINRLAYDKHIHSNSTALNAVTGTNTGDENTTRIGRLISGATEKTTPVDADMVGLMDSAASNILKKLSWANIKTTLKASFDTVYTKLSFSKIRVGGVDIVASTYDDRIEFIAGTNITLTPDTNGKKLTIESSGGGSATYREIKVNNTSVLNSSNGSPINIRNGTGTVVDGGYGNGEYIIAISAYMGLLTDANYGIDLQSPGDVGVWTLIPGQSYLNTPNPICGTDVDSISLSGTYTYVSNSDGGTWTYHDQNTNKMYISSWYNDPINGDTPTPWKRLLTCADEIATEPEELDPYSYLINNTNQHIYIDSNNFDFKSDKIIIDLATYTSYVGVKINIGIHFSPDTQNPVDITIIDNNNKPIQFGSSNVYTDPLTISNTYWIEYEIYNLQPYWLVGNRIYS